MEEHASVKSAYAYQVLIDPAIARRTSRLDVRWSLAKGEQNSDQAQGRC